METVAVLAVLVLLLAAAAPALYLWRRRTGAPRKLEFWRLLHRRGLSADDAIGEPRNVALAVRRCALCPSVARCEEWLASGDRDGFAEFCPNAAFVRKLERA